MRRSILSTPQRPIAYLAPIVLVAALALGGDAQARSVAPPAPAVGAGAGTAPAVGAAGASVAVPARRPATAAAARDVAVVRPARRPHRVGARAAATARVVIADFRFGPSAIVVHAGDTVTWSNEGPSDHTATGAGFDTGVLRQGASGSHTFTSAGTFAYHCTIHRFMKGTVTVLASSAPSPTASPAPSAASAPTAARGATAVRQTLPRTGLDARTLALGGLLSLALGVLLRRLIERR
jgi:plastocyanin